MSIKQSSMLRKAQTHPFALPQIKKQKNKFHSFQTSRRLENKSTFLEKVKNETSEEKYDYMQTSKITEEQKSLKGLLRRFNDQSFNILSRYVERPSDSSNKKNRGTSHSIAQIKDKQLSNNKIALELCQKELANLQERCQHLKLVDYEGFQRKITELKYEKEEMIQVNKEIKKRNVLRGQDIKKGHDDDHNDVSEIGKQLYANSLRKQRLEQDKKYAEEEEKSLQSKHLEADQKIKKILAEYEEMKKQLENQKEQQKMKEKIEQKKKLYAKKKEHNSNIKHQYSYLKMLKQLGETRKKCEQLDHRTKQTEKKIQNSKKELLLFEHKYTAVKKIVINSPIKEEKIEKEIKQQPKKVDQGSWF